MDEDVKLPLVHTCKTKSPFRAQQLLSAGVGHFLLLLLLRPDITALVDWA